MIQNLFSGKVHAVPTRLTATAAEAPAIICDMCIKSGADFLDVLVVDHDPKFMSTMFQAFVKSTSSAPAFAAARRQHRGRDAAAFRPWMREAEATAGRSSGGTNGQAEAKVGSTLSSPWATACCCVQKSCSTPPIFKLVSYGRVGKAPSS